MPDLLFTRLRSHQSSTFLLHLFRKSRRRRNQRERDTDMELPSLNTNSPRLNIPSNTSHFLITTFPS
ncbi:Uncharacterized protein APZ42_018626 [Daphnia magna]|uniref:Uncharacterized protein n=1 Tax=Daphnia magna TaxID=35525 RepID=A0A164YP49_9CRUS|nr:Uncharacterized protein APZ42_018626 [Daphnia magna]